MAVRSSKNCRFAYQLLAWSVAVFVSCLSAESIARESDTAALRVLADSIDSLKDAQLGTLDQTIEKTRAQTGAGEQSGIGKQPNTGEATLSDKAQEVKDAAANAREKADDEVGEEDDLDALLDMADEDVDQLAQVRVQPVRREAASAVTAEQFTPTPSLRTQVTSVNRQATSVGRTPAAVSVITSDMIRRSGARTIPDALRLIPGVQVARIDANKWAISIRGFNQRFANKLLVQIDGRPVYTPLFGGTYWDVQDVVLEDIDRIELVRGPGATVWGAPG